MRALPFFLLALSSTMLTSACSPEFDAQEQKNKTEINEGSEELQLRLATASESAGDLAAAERMYLKLSKNGKPQSIIDIASFYTRHNQPERAVTLLQSAYANSPDDINLMRMLANSLISVGQAEKALSMLEGSIAGNGANNAYVYNSRGVALDTLGRYSLAQQSYRKAIALNPADEVDFKTNLSMSHILAGEYKNAIDLLDPLFKSKNSTPQARQNLALAYGLLGDMDTAMNIGSKDVSIKEMRENIRFYQHVSNRKSSVTKKATLPPDMLPVALKPFSADETEELPPPPPAPVRNLTQTTKQESSIELESAPQQQKVKVYTPAPDLSSAPSNTAAAEIQEAVKHKMITTSSTNEDAVPKKVIAPNVAKPVVEPSKEKKANENAVEILQEEASEVKAPQPNKSEPAPLMSKDALPTPVLKPDSW